MCFERRELTTKPLVAKKDIKVKKATSAVKKGDSYVHAFFTGNHGGFRYTVGRVHKEKRFFNKREKGCYTLTYGFHSFSKKHTALQYMRYWIGYSIVDAIIPKGSLYFYDEQRGEYISNQLVIQPIKSSMVY